MTLTPEQFNKLVTKDEFNDKIGQLESKIDNLTENVSGLITAVDGVVHELKNINLELAANVQAHDRFETRITRLEKVNNL